MRARLDRSERNPKQTLCKPLISLSLIGFICVVHRTLDLELLALPDSLWNTMAFPIAPLIRVRSMVQVHLGPLNVSPGQGGCHPDEYPLEAARSASNSKKTQRHFPGPSRPRRLQGPEGSVVATIQLRNELVLPVWEQVAVEVVGRSDVRVPHAPHDLGRNLRVRFGCLTGCGCVDGLRHAGWAGR